MKVIGWIGLCIALVAATPNAFAAVETRTYVNRYCPISDYGSDNRFLGAFFAAVLAPAIAERLIKGIGTAIENASKEKKHTLAHTRYLHTYEYVPGTRKLRFSPRIRCFTTIVGEFSAPDDRVGNLQPQDGSIETSDRDPYWTLSGLQKLGFPVSKAPHIVAEFRVVASVDQSSFQLKREFLQRQRPFSSSRSTRGLAIAYEFAAPGPTENSTVLTSIPMALGSIKKTDRPSVADFSGVSHALRFSGQVNLPGLTPEAYFAYLRLRPRAKNILAIGPVALKTTVIETEAANKVGLFVAGLLKDIAEDVGTAVKSELDSAAKAATEDTAFASEKEAVAALQAAKVALAKAQLACSEADCETPPATPAKAVALAELEAARVTLEYAETALERTGFESGQRSRSRRGRNLVQPAETSASSAPDDAYESPVPIIDTDNRYVENLCAMRGIDCSEGLIRPEIYLGEAVPTDKFENTVALLLEGVNEIGATETSLCSGSLVASRWVLSARHCMERANGVDWEIKQAVFGLDVDAARDAERKILGVEACVDFASNTRIECRQRALSGVYRDIVAVRLDAAAPEEPMRIASPMFINDAKYLTAVGFGLTEELGPNNERRIGEKRYVEVPVVTPDCSGMSRGVTDEQRYDCVPGQEIVAGRGSYNRRAAADTCGGDSGGTMFATRARGDNTSVWPHDYLLAGVTSRAIPAAQAVWPWCGDGGIYGRVDRPVTEWLAGLASQDGESITVVQP